MGLISLAIMTPFLIKSSATGYGPIEYSKSETCEVFDTHVVLTKTHGITKATFEFPYKAEGTWTEMIEGALSEQYYEVDNYLCDGPSTYISAKYIQDGVEKSVLLYSTGGCGMPKKTRIGPNSFALIEFAGTFCPRTH